MGNPMSLSNPGETYIWRVTRPTYERFLDLGQRLLALEIEAEEAYIVREDIRRLPGFPKDNHPDLDRIVIQVEDQIISD